METSHVQVIDRALDIIEQLATSEKGLSITELARRTDLPKSTVHRILSSFIPRHLIEKNEQTNLYMLGYKFVEISSIYLNKIVLKTEAVPIMHNIASTFNAISYLCVLDQNEVMYLERIEQFNSIRLYYDIGKREPVYCTALGKVLLSQLPEDEFEELGKNIQYVKRTTKTITNFEALARDVAQARIDGYAVDRGEHVETSYCLEVPIYDFTRKVIAAMSVSRLDLFKAFKQEVVLAKMREAAEQLSLRMGYTKPK